MIPIIRIQAVLEEAGYRGVADNDASKWKCQSPFTQRPIVIPVNISDSVPEFVVAYLLRDEPNRDELIQRMRE